MRPPIWPFLFISTAAAAAGLPVLPPSVRVQITSAKVVRLKAPAPARPRIITKTALSTPERRPGESDGAFRLRTLFLERYQEFLKLAAPSSDEQQKLIGVLADEQGKWLRAIDDANQKVRDIVALRFQILHTKDPVQKLRLLRALRSTEAADPLASSAVALNAELHRSMGFLTARQVAIYEQAVGTVEMFGCRPIDVPPPALPSRPSTQ